MKTTKKIRITALFMTVIISLAVFTACTAKNEKPESESSDSAISEITVSSQAQSSTESMPESSEAAISQVKKKPSAKKKEEKKESSKAQSATVSSKEETSKAESKVSTAKKKNGSGVFKNSVFFGNSFVESLKEYNLPKGCDFIYRVGLSVTTALTKSVPGHDIPIIDELGGGQYDKIFTFFGENELGWYYPDIFIEKYEKLISQIKSRQPDAEIYVMAVFPVSAGVSNENIEQTNNSRINKYNKLIKKMAAEIGVHFIDPSSVLKNKDGALPDDAASDGIHFGKSYCKKMLDYVAENI